MTFILSKEEATSLALKSSTHSALSDSVKWMPSFDSLDSSEALTSLAVSAFDDDITGVSIAFVLAVVMFDFFAGVTEELLFLAVLHFALSLHD